MQLHGGEQVPVSTTVLAKMKPAWQEAVSSGLLEKSKVTVLKETKTGTKPGKADALTLTEAGRAALETQADPVARAAAAPNPTDQLLRQIEGDRAAVLEQAQKALKAKTVQTAVGKVAKDVAALRKQLDKVEERLERMAATDPVSQALEGLESALDTIAARLEALPASAKVEQAAAQPSKTTDLRSDIQRAYRKCTHYAEYEDGTVDIPRLYHETKRLRPGVALEELHAELLALWDERQVELGVNNDSRAAKEPDKGIRRDGRLLYYVSWV